jgi:S-DNA-T family DNA segregation ATPase FtsK/SpoIIIE
VARTRRTTTRATRTGARNRSRSGGTGRQLPSLPQLSLPHVAPDTLRSLLGIALLVAGSVTLIALFLPSGGLFNAFVSHDLRPNFGQGAWLLGVLLLVAGVLVERSPKVGNGWGVAAIGALLVFIGGEGLIHLVSGRAATAEDLAQGGGRLGNALSASLSDLVSDPGAFVVLIGVVVAGILLLFNLTLRSLFAPVGAGGRVIAGATTATVAAVAARTRTDGDDSPTRPMAIPIEQAPVSRRVTRNGGGTAGDVMPELPTPLPSPAPMSHTVWAASTLDGGSRATGTLASPARASATALAAPPAARPEILDLDEVAQRPLRLWELPTLALLDETSESAGAALLDHERNVRIIEEKLRSFHIPAQVVGSNTGPVVTQYEVKPDVRVKLSRIEGLADDLAMALAARSIRIEAPIPGRDVVGIEIPNHASEVVGFRRLYQDARMGDATSKLTFALGRDVSGTAFAVDLARMPHLLIAGATGSGKSVCINALITSLLMRATPDEVELVLVDLKRVELAPYAGLPHLKAEVIVEAHQARAALGWAVAQMEDRYRLLAARGERNIAAFNASDRVDPGERLPYLVVVIDELADLMMREGRKVEDPIVKLAQKARAVGIHLVLATQRPSVNVVTGLIKANVPSRIAFAMASNVDSRTVLDAPGAEDLIGRGDMLYQPADLPRPVRLQGVFVSDAEVRAVTDHWRSQAPAPAYDPEVLAGAGGEDGEDGGQFGWLARLAEDELTPRAAELVLMTGKASTSMMQTKLKVGFNRASRLMDELERFGIVGPQDPRNPAVPRQVYGPENWIRGPEDVDDL